MVEEVGSEVKRFKKRAAFGMQAQRYPEMLRMVGAGQLHPDNLVDQRVPIEKVSDVLESMSGFGTTGVAVINKF